MVPVRLSHAFMCDLEGLFRVFWFVQWQGMCLNVCTSLSVVRCLAMRFTCPTIEDGRKIVELYTLWFSIVSGNQLVLVPICDMCSFIHSWAMSSNCQLDLIREYTWWRYNFGPRQSHSEVLSVRVPHEISEHPVCFRSCRLYVVCFVVVIVFPSIFFSSIQLIRSLSICCFVQWFLELTVWVQTIRQDQIVCEVDVSA